MQYINLKTKLVQDESEIRSLHPNTSFPVPFVAPSDYAPVFPAPQPVHNPVTQTVAGASPELTSKGHWEQRWTVTELYKTTAKRTAAVKAAAELQRQAAVPRQVEMRQVRLALHQAGHLETVEASIAGMDKKAQIEWEFALTVLHQSPLVSLLATVLNITELQVDELFTIAATL